MDQATVEGWLAAYGKAWEWKDTQAFVALFAADVRYYWTPFEEPKRGSLELAQAFELAVARQEEIDFRAVVLSVSGNTGIAHWHCSFKRVPGGRHVQLDGIFQMEFDTAALCRVFREWWHSDELP